MAYGYKPKKASTAFHNPRANRHTSNGPAKKLGSSANVARHAATHIKSKVKRYT